MVKPSIFNKLPFAFSSKKLTQNPLFCTKSENDKKEKKKI